MIIQSLLLALVLNLAASLGTAAADPPLLGLESDFNTLELTQPTAPRHGNTKDQLTSKIPVSLGTKDLNIDRVIVSHSGRLIPQDAAKFTLEPNNNGGTLSATIDVSKLEEAGTYHVTLEVSGHPQAPAQEKTAVGSEQQQQTPEKRTETIKLTLTKPAAELKVSTPLRVERVVNLPWQDDSIEPDKITLNESVGKSWMAISPTIWNVVLRKGEEPPEKNRLIMDYPQYIDGWGQADAKVKIEGPISIGSSSGVLTIRSPQITNKTVDFPITVVL